MTTDIWGLLNRVNRKDRIVSLYNYKKKSLFRLRVPSEKKMPYMLCVGKLHRVNVENLNQESENGAKFWVGETLTRLECKHPPIDKERESEIELLLKARTEITLDDFVRKKT